MAFYHSRVSAFSLASADLSDYVDSVTVNISVEAAETTGIGNASKTYMVGLKDGSISLSGRYDDTATTGVEAVFKSALDGTAAVAFSFEPAGSSEVDYSGNGIVTSFEVSAPVGGVVAFTAEIQVTGGVTITPGA